MKKSLFILLTMGSFLLFTACATPTERIEPTMPTQAVATETLPTEADTAFVIEESSSPQNNYYIYQGTVIEVSTDMTSLTMQDSGTQDPIIMDISTADMEHTAELATGSEITVFCLEDADKAIVIADKQEGPTVMQVKGQVSRLAMSTFSIKLEDGSELDFLKNNTEGLTAQVFGTSIDENNGTDAVVLVTYTELSYGDDVSVLIPLKTQPAS